MSQNQAQPTVVVEKEEERGKDDKRVGEKREKHEKKKSSAWRNPIWLTRLRWLWPAFMVVFCSLNYQPLIVAHLTQARNICLKQIYLNSPTKAVVWNWVLRWLYSVTRRHIFTYTIQICRQELFCPALVYGLILLVFTLLLNSISFD